MLFTHSTFHSMLNQNTTEYMAPNTVRYWATRMSIGFALLTLPFLAQSVGAWLSAFVAVEMFLGLPIAIYFTLDYKNTSFTFDGKRLTINSGIISKTSRSIPLHNIQNVGVTSGLVARMFNVATVRIWTSSPSQLNIVSNNRGSRTANTPDGLLFLSQENGAWLKDFLLTQNIPH
jgi:uncharacterized membrane protein YdbT with pleckstrin-like domain